jgi:hypothetical protein
MGQRLKKFFLIRGPESIQEFLHLQSSLFRYSQVLLEFLTLSSIMAILSMFFSAKTRFLTILVDFERKVNAGSKQDAAITGGYSENQHFESFAGNTRI